MFGSNDRTMSVKCSNAFVSIVADHCLLLSFVLLCHYAAVVNIPSEEYKYRLTLPYCIRCMYVISYDGSSNYAIVYCCFNGYMNPYGLKFNTSCRTDIEQWVTVLRSIHERYKNTVLTNGG